MEYMIFYNDNRTSFLMSTKHIKQEKYYRDILAKNVQVSPPEPGLER